MSKVITTPETSLTLTTASDYQLKISDFTAYRDSFIFTNECRLATDEGKRRGGVKGPSILKARNLHLHTSGFRVLPENAIISTAGEPGEYDTGSQGGQAHGNPDGASAYSFNFSSLHFDVDRLFTVDARGGDGAHGYDGKVAGVSGGKGGNGGAGGDVSLVFNDTFRNLVLSARDIKSASTVTDRDAWVKTWLNDARTLSQPQSLVNKVNQFANDYNSLSPEDFTQRLEELLDALENASLQFSASLAVDCSGGRYGTGGDGVPKMGQNGHGGIAGMSRSPCPMTPLNIRNSTECLFHPDQIAMTLRDAENNYFVGTNASLLKAYQALESIIKRLSFLSDLQPGDPLSKAYHDNEMSFFVLPSGVNEATSVTSLKSSLNAAQQYNDNLIKRLDFFGHEPTWVPRGSYEFYQNQLEQMLVDFSKIETNYNTYQTMAKDQTTRDAQISLAKLATQRSLDQAKDDASSLFQDLGLTSDRIEDLQMKLPKKHKELDEQIDSLADKIKNSFKVSFSDFLGAATQMAFAPSGPMAVIQGASLLNTAATKVTDDNGNTSPKGYAVNKIYSLKGDLDGLEEAVKFGPGDGIASVDDPKATKLIGEEKDIMNFVDQYRGLLGDSSILVVKRMFDDYIQAVLDRNNQVMHWNACVTLWAQTQAKISSCNATLASLGSQQVTEIRFEIPAAAVAVEQNYFDTTQKVLRTLYQVQKSMDFWTMSTSDESLTKIRQEGFPRPGLSAALSQAKIDLLSEFQSAVDRFGESSSDFGGSMNILPVKVHLTEDQMDSLREGEGAEYAVIINIPPVYKTTSREDSPFSGWADVRLTEVRFYVKGVTTGDDSLQIALQHMGRETIVDSNNNSHQYTHDPLYLTFQYDLKTGLLYSPGTIAKAVEGQYALPGPFCLWRIAIDKARNLHLEMAGLKEAWLEFSGTKRSFSS